MATPIGTLFNDPRAKPTSAAGLAQPGAYYQYYLTQTTTPANVYKDGALTIPAVQTPGTGDTTLAGDGRMIPIYMNPAIIYRVQLYSAIGVLLEDTDPYIPPATIGLLVTMQTAAEAAAGVTPTNYGYAPGNMLRYGGDNSGVFDNSSIFYNQAARQAQQVGGAPVFFPKGLWKGNFVAVGQNVTIQCDEDFYYDTTNTGFIAANNANPIWQFGDAYTITGITQAASAVVTINDTRAFNPVFVGMNIAFQGVVGMTQINGLTGNVTAVGGVSGAWTFTVAINSSAFTAYASAGVSAPLVTDINLRGSFKMHGGGVANYGARVFGVQNLDIDRLIARGCLLKNLELTSSIARPSSYINIKSGRADAWPSASSIGVDAYQPSNYPTSYCSAINLNNFNTQANAAGLWGVRVQANTVLNWSNSYLSMINNAGMNFPDAGGTGVIQATNLFMDTLGTTNDVLITCADNNPLPQHLNGVGVTVNGKVSINGLVSAAPLGGYGNLGNRMNFLNPAITGALYFQSTAANKADQTQYASTLATMFWNGSNLFISNGGSGAGGAVIVAGTSLTLTNYGGSADGKIVFGISGQSIQSNSGGIQLSATFAINGATPPAQTTGWGTPVGGAVINNYNITDAGGANSNTNKALAEIIAILKSMGIIGN